MDFEKLAQDFQGLGLSIKTQLDTTRKNINTSKMSAENKADMLKEIETIEKSIANPDGGFSDILKSIDRLNQHG